MSAQETQIIVGAVQVVLLILHAERKNKKVNAALAKMARVLRLVSQYQGGVNGDGISLPGSGSSSDGSSGSGS